MKTRTNLTVNNYQKQLDYDSRKEKKKLLKTKVRGLCGYGKVTSQTFIIMSEHRNKALCTQMPQTTSLSSCY